MFEWYEAVVVTRWHPILLGMVVMVGWFGLGVFAGWLVWS